MGRWHAYYVRRAGGSVRAIVDRDRQAAARMQQPNFSGAAVFSELAECLESCPVDAVHICTGSASHAALASTAMQSGKHVLVEKPAALTRDDAVQLARIAQEHRVLLCPVHQFVFQDGYCRLVRQLSSLGEPVRISYRVNSAGGTGREPGERREVLLEILPHAVSLLKHVGLVGRSDLRWSVARFTPDNLDLVGQWDDTLVDIALTLQGRPPRNEFCVVGSSGTALVDLFHGFLVRQSGSISRLAKVVRPLGLGLAVGRAASMNLMRRAIRRQPAYPGLSRLIGEFYRCIRTGSPPPLGADDIIKSAALMDLVRDSTGCSGESVLPVTATYRRAT